MIEILPVPSSEPDGWFDPPNRWANSLPTTPLTAMSTPRIQLLEGIRGVAAAVLVVGQCLATTPAFSRLPLTWPAVACFLVISGFVLARPAADGEQRAWRRYYPHRLVRLGLPIAAAAGMALTLAWLGLARATSGSPAADLRWWQPLWSLHGLLLVSLLLPGYVWAADRLRRFRLAGLLVPAVVLLLAAALRLDWLLALAAAGFGVGLAYQRQALAALAQRLRALPDQRALLAAGVFCAVALLNGGWLQVLLTGRAAPAGATAAVVGAALVTAAAVVIGGTRPITLPPLLAWLGSRSFSLFLVHGPVVVGVAELLGPALNPFSILFFSVPTTLLLAEGFDRWVQAPSRVLAVRAGRQGDLVVTRFRQRCALRDAALLTDRQRELGLPVLARTSIAPRHASDRDRVPVRAQAARVRWQQNRVRARHNRLRALRRRMQGRLPELQLPEAG